MIIRELTKEQVIRQARETLEIPTNDSRGIDDVFLASSIRRASSFLCPCSQSTLINQLFSSLCNLVDDRADLETRIEDGIHRLIVGGDLLELSNVSTNDLNAKGTWLFAAPPSFVVRPNGNAYIFGIVHDENLAIPSFSNRITYRGFKRVLRPDTNENIEVLLRDLGLIFLSEKAWLKSPKRISSAKYLSDMLEKFPNELRGDLEDIEILNNALPWNYYRKRWTKPRNETGFYVARRPQLYGASTWCFVELSNGMSKRFIDLPLSLNGITQRGCDTAWHLQAAIDSENKNSHFYRVREANDEKILDFFCPIPLWAERRLVAIGDIVKGSNCLFSYSIPHDEFVAEADFLKEYLWMEPQT